MFLTKNAQEKSKLEPAPTAVSNIHTLSKKMPQHQLLHTKQFLFKEQFLHMKKETSPHATSPEHFFRRTIQIMFSCALTES
jgi:hypothetical protein